jgi:glutathione peroxidase
MSKSVVIIHNFYVRVVKALSLFFLPVLLLIMTSYTASSQSEIKSIYQFKVRNIRSDTFDFASLRGKKVILVNTASKCMYTPQYRGLQELYTTYKDSGLMIIAFPCNDFANREPYNNFSIRRFCEKKYEITFPLMSKISVKGEQQSDVYKYLTTKSLNGYADNKVEWNFQKYLINEEGFLEMIIPPRKGSLSKEIIEWIEK